MILHECVSGFALWILQMILGGLYWISSIRVISPHHFGYPANRYRRYTLLCLKSFGDLQFPFELNYLKPFMKKVVLTGIYLCRMVSRCVSSVL